MYTYKVMIHPNNKQATKIRRTLAKCIESNILVHKYLDSFLAQGLPLPKEGEVRKWWTIQKSILDNQTINKRLGLTKQEIIAKHLDTLFYDVSNDALKQEVKDVYNAYVRYFKKLAKHPVAKKYNSYKKSYYVDPYKIKFTDRKVKLEKITNSLKENRRVINYVSLAERNRIPINVKYYNPRVVLEGDKFYIVVSVDDENAPTKYKTKKLKLKNETLGIDLNINSFVTSDNTVYESIVRKSNYIKADNKYKLYQSLCSKKLDYYKKNKIKKTKSYYKLKRKKDKYRLRCKNIKLAYFDNIIIDIIRKSYAKINIEDLDIKNMKESYNLKKENNNLTTEDNEKKYIASGIQENPFGIFIKRLVQLTSKYGITINKINRYYPSSKKCSICGEIRKNLKLSDRTYICDKCGLIIDRDLNAAINIANYK